MTLASRSMRLRWLNGYRSFASKARVVVVGSGRMGTIRARLVQSNHRYELVGIVDPVSAQGDFLAGNIGVRRWSISCSCQAD